MDWIEWFYNKNLERLETYRGILDGRTVVLSGTGPSLDETPFEYVRGQILMVVNTFFFVADKFSVTPDFLCISDHRTYTQSAYEGLMALRKPLFLSHSAAVQHLRTERDLYGGDDPKTWHIPEGSPILTSLSLEDMRLLRYRNTGKFNGDVTQPNLVGGTVIIDNALQLLFFMEAGRVIMIGCDWKWDQKKKHVTGAENSYYFPGVPKTTKNVMLNFRKCREAYEAHGRKIYNASPVTANDEIQRIALKDVKWDD